MKEDINYNRIKSAMEFIVLNYNSQPRIKDVVNHVNLSEFHFQRIFKEWAGVSPKKFLQYITLKALKSNILNSKNIIELSETVGLSSQSRVYDLFINSESVSPHEFKTKGDGILIQYGIHNSPFGECFIANTTRGICALEFVDNDLAGTIELFKEKWKNAEVSENQETTKHLINQCFGISNKPIKALLFGTDFQIKVWEALIKIPHGALTSYSAIAELIDKPKASRAVGNAIGKNNIALLIPCHRVIQGLGGIGGYKWGEERKLSIIGYEKSIVMERSIP
jgi:AraC family transcriptional regulator of adaptative response/methylated-DNA-[protein]-cysteine methyltransferase